MMKKTVLAFVCLLLSAVSAFCARKVPADKPLDLSACVNISVDAEGDDGEFYPLKKIKSGKFGGVDFRLAKDSDGGLFALTLASPRAPRTRSATIDFGEKPTVSYFLYVLHSSGKNTRVANQNKNIGRIIVEYADGMKDTFWVKRDNDAISTFEKRIGDNALPVYVEDRENDRGVVYLSRYNLARRPIKKITFSSTRYAAWNIFGATLSRKDVQTCELFEFKPDEWKPIDVSDLEVADGSALDVSADMGDTPAGKFGRLKVMPDGTFAFEKAPDKRVKFKGTNWRPGDWFFKRINTKEDIDVLARAARKQGYNLVRWRLSMGGEKEFDAPYQMKPEVLDMYDYFLYAMAREGVYTHLHLASHDLGDPSFKWADRNSVKLEMALGDKSKREAWRKLVAMQLNHVNPYTGKKWKDDPAIATTEYFNEMEIGCYTNIRLRPDTIAYADSEFRAWLEKKYGTIEKLKAAWERERLPTNFSDFSGIKVFGNGKFNSSLDRSLFMRERIADFLKYCENVVRNEEKFTAPLHQFNCGVRVDLMRMSAEGGEYMAQNVYFAHGTNFMAADSRTPQGSALEIGEPMRHFRAAAAKRMADRPMVLTEWQHCHWNPYKHESGVAFPALAALQNFDNLTIHDVAIEKRGEGVFGHAEVSKNPILRANEFLTYCFFYRGDVKKSPHRVDLVFTDKFLGSDVAATKAVNPEQSKISFMTGFAIDFPDARKMPNIADTRAPKPDIVLPPTGYAESEMLQNASVAGKAGGEKFDLDKFADELKSRGILPAGNLSKPSEGIFQSDTGEIVFRLKERLVRVVTPKSEAVALKPETKNEKLGVLEVESTDVPASVGIVAVDGKTLAETSRAVLVYATDTVATDFKVSKSREALKFRGRQPILLRVGKLSSKIALPKRDDGKKYALYALKLNGTRTEKLAEGLSGNAEIKLDTSKMKEPAVFYEIIAE